MTSANVVDQEVQWQAARCRPSTSAQVHGHTGLHWYTGTASLYDICSGARSQCRRWSKQCNNRCSTLTPCAVDISNAFDRVDWRRDDAFTTTCIRLEGRDTGRCSTTVVKPRQHQWRMRDWKIKWDSVTMNNGCCILAYSASKYRRAGRQRADIWVMNDCRWRHIGAIDNRHRTLGNVKSAARLYSQTDSHHRISVLQSWQRWSMVMVLSRFDDIPPSSSIQAEWSTCASAVAQRTTENWTHIYLNVVNVAYMKTVGLATTAGGRWYTREWSLTNNLWAIKTSQKHINNYVCDKLISLQLQFVFGSKIEIQL